MCESMIRFPCKNSSVYCLPSVTLIVFVYPHMESPKLLYVDTIGQNCVFFMYNIRVLSRNFCLGGAHNYSTITGVHRGESLEFWVEAPPPPPMDRTLNIVHQCYYVIIIIIVICTVHDNLYMHTTWRILCVVYL